MKNCLTTYNEITQEGYMKINAKWFKYIGLETSVLFFLLLDQEGYWIKEARIMPDGWFYDTDANIQKIMPWDKDTIGSHIKRLKKLGLIKTELRGMPKIRWVQINRPLVYKFAHLIGIGNTELLEQCNNILSDKNFSGVAEFVVAGEVLS